MHIEIAWKYVLYSEACLDSFLRAISNFANFIICFWLFLIFHLGIFFWRFRLKQCVSRHEEFQWLEKTMSAHVCALCFWWKMKLFHGLGLHRMLRKIAGPPVDLCGSIKKKIAKQKYKVNKLFFAIFILQSCSFMPIINCFFTNEPK